MLVTEKSTIRVHQLLNAFLRGDLSPEEVVEDIYEKIAQHSDYNIWIYTTPKDEVLQQIALNRRKLESGYTLPLYCIPFAVKDNIDVAGMPTTAACPAYSYTPAQHAAVVQKLIDAGAIVIGKTNLDQFATGLTGTRSPFGAVRNSVDPLYISGGSSSGSAVAVALGMSCFSLGTDTAGSGRVPAGFNNLVGLKPGIGRLSTQGVVPACKSLDCVSVFTTTIEDASLVYHIASEPETILPVNTAPQKKSILIPDEQGLFFAGNNEEYASLFSSVISKASGTYPVKRISFQLFSDTAALLYHGPWIAERMAAVGSFIKKHPDEVHPVVRSIIAQAEGYTGTDTFSAFYKLETLRTQALALFDQADYLLVPTAPGIFTIEEVLQNPVELNTRLGYYTNFVNLLGLCAVAVPAGFTSQGLPFGVTLIAPAGSEVRLLEEARKLQALLKSTNTPALQTDTTELAVAGLHKRSFPLNYQLTDLEASYAYSTQTSPDYAMYLLDPDGKPKPGLVRLPEGQGHSIDVEVWQIPVKNLGAFMMNVKHPLGIGQVRLADGRMVYGFICEQYIAGNCEDISAYKSWEAFTGSRSGR